MKTPPIGTASEGRWRGRISSPPQIGKFLNPSSPAARIVEPSDPSRIEEGPKKIKAAEKVYRRERAKLVRGTGFEPANSCETGS